MKRGKMARGDSRKVFKKSAGGTHWKNVAAPMRGGIRL